MIRSNDTAEDRFLQGLLNENKNYKRKNREAHALFQAIDAAFYRVTKGFTVETVPVKEELIQYLAICAKAALNPDADGDVDLEVDFIFVRALRGFMQTLRWAILERRNVFTNAEGETMFGCFVIPKQFLELWEKERDETVAHVRQLREGHPGSHLRAVSER